MTNEEEIHTENKESTLPYLIFFKFAFLILTTLFLIVSVATNSVADYIQLPISRKIFNPNQSDAFFLIKMSFCIFILRNILVEFKNFAKSFANNLWASITSSLLLFIAIDLSILSSAGILLLTTLAIESPLYAAIILSALIVTLQGLKQLKAIPKDDKSEEEMKQATHRAAMLGVTPSLIKRIEAMEPKKENSHE